MQSSGVPAHLEQWSWSCSVHGKPRASANGNGTDLEDCKAKFKAAWVAIRAGLSKDDIASAREYAENSLEARARRCSENASVPTRSRRLSKKRCQSWL
jgi:hypothetical protein